MGLTYPPKAWTRRSSADLDIEVNIPLTENPANGCNCLQEVNGDRRKKARRCIICWAPILLWVFLFVCCDLFFVWL